LLLSSPSESGAPIVVGVFVVVPLGDAPDVDDVVPPGVGVEDEGVEDAGGGAGRGGPSTVMLFVAALARSPESDPLPLAASPVA
jgi:hypothetical protein